VRWWPGTLAAESFERSRIARLEARIDGAVEVSQIDVGLTAEEDVCPTDKLIEIGHASVGDILFDLIKFADPGADHSSRCRPGSPDYRQ